MIGLKADFEFSLRFKNDSSAAAGQIWGFDAPGRLGTACKFSGVLAEQDLRQDPLAVNVPWGPHLSSLQSTKPPDKHRIKCETSEEALMTLGQDNI